MKKLKTAFWIVVLGFIGLLIAQNWSVFQAESSLSINLLFFKYQSPEMANAVFFVAVFFFGLLVSYLVSLFKRFKDAKTIRTMAHRERQLLDTMADLEKQLSDLRKPEEAAPAEPAPEEPVDAQAEEVTPKVS